MLTDLKRAVAGMAKGFDLTTRSLFQSAHGLDRNFHKTRLPLLPRSRKRFRPVRENRNPRLPAGLPITAVVRSLWSGRQGHSAEPDATRGNKEGLQGHPRLRGAVRQQGAGNRPRTCKNRQRQRPCQQPLLGLHRRDTGIFFQKQAVATAQRGQSRRQPRGATASGSALASSARVPPASGMSRWKSKLEAGNTASTQPEVPISSHSLGTTA